MKDEDIEWFVSYWGTQTSFLAGNDGNISLDFVGKLENLEDDYNKMRDMHPLFPEFKKTIVLNKNTSRISAFRMDHPLMEKNKDFIYEVFKDDFINLGYEK